jgi:hypothetical protein
MDFFLWGYTKDQVHHGVLRMGILPDAAKWSRTASHQTIENDMPMQATKGL